MEEVKKFKILKRKADCVLLAKQESDGRVKFLVKDIENDIIYMSYAKLERAEQAFDEYDINKVREERKKIFEQWLEEFAEA